MLTRSCCFTQDIANYTGEWPQHVFMAMGGAEFSGVRGGKGKENDAYLTKYAENLGAMLTEQGLGPDRLHWEVEQSATHTESAWARRLPQAMKFLLGHWWQPLLAQRHADDLFFTTPRRLKCGQPGVLLFDKSKSTPLQGLNAQEGLQLVAGFNGWDSKLGNLKLSMSQSSTQLAGESHAANPAGSLGVTGSDWWVVPLGLISATAYEVNFVFSNGSETVWDNNDSADFYIPVRQMDGSMANATACQTSGESNSSLCVLQQAAAMADANADMEAGRNRHKKYFTMPPTPIAGAPATFYINRAKLGWGLAGSPNIRMRLGFNNWELGVLEESLKPTNLWREHGIDWWGVKIQIPEGASGCAFVITDGVGGWDNNDGHDYLVPVQQHASSSSSSSSSENGSSNGHATAIGATARKLARTIASREGVEHAGGRLEILELEKREGKGKSRWWDERRLRVWTPPGFNVENPPPGGWPVLYFVDGQNIFEDWLAHQGVSWKIGYTAAHLIGLGRLPPFLIVGIDSAGPMRSYNYLPFPPGTGEGGFRGDAERWPGGGADAFLQRVVDEIVPLMHQEFAVSVDPSRVAFGGGSFGGVCSMMAAMQYPHVFGAVLAESPSLWVGEGRFLGELASHSGRLPERLCMGAGTREYSATRDHDRDDVDALLLHYYCEAARLLGEKGLRGNRLKFQVEEGAGHHELAWQWRLTGMLEFLLSPWWDL